LGALPLLLLLPVLLVPPLFPPAELLVVVDELEEDEPEKVLTGLSQVLLLPSLVLEFGLEKIRFSKLGLLLLLPVPVLGL
jgi:hypothetical protein